MYKFEHKNARFAHMIIALSILYYVCVSESVASVAIFGCALVFVAMTSDSPEPHNRTNTNPDTVITITHTARNIRIYDCSRVVFDCEAHPVLLICRRRCRRMCRRVVVAHSTTQVSDCDCDSRLLRLCVCVDLLIPIACRLITAQELVLYRRNNGKKCARNAHNILERQHKAMIMCLKAAVAVCANQIHTHAHTRGVLVFGISLACECAQKQYDAFSHVIGHFRAWSRATKAIFFKCARSSRAKCVLDQHF